MVAGEVAQGDLRKLIADLNAQMEAYPRQNKNCVEFYEKYKLKYEELDSKFEQQQKTEEQIAELLVQLRQKKAKSIEENFKLLSLNFSSIFKSVVKAGSAQLKLVKMVPADSQQSHPSQYPDSQQEQFTIGDTLYKGIRVLVSFTSEQAGSEDRE